MRQEQLSVTIDHFFSFIQARGDEVDQAKNDIMGFFSRREGTHVVHDQGGLYFYQDKKLLYFKDAAVSDSPMIHTFDGRKITSVSPYPDNGTRNRRFLMKSGDSKGRGTRRKSGFGGVSSNNNNNNNNNNNG